MHRQTSKTSFESFYRGQVRGLPDSLAAKAASSQKPANQFVKYSLHSRLFFLALFSLGILLSACGLDGETGEGIRGSWEVGVSPDGSGLNSLFASGEFGCQAAASRTEVASGEVFTVNVTVFNANGTAKLASGIAANSSGIISYTTAFTNTSGDDILWSPTVRVSDSKNSASCRFQVYVVAQPYRRL